MTDDIHVIVKTSSSSDDQWVGRFESQVTQKVTRLQYEILSSIKKKFGRHDPWKSSQPGTYPYRLSGAARRSIVIKDISLPNIRGFKITTEGEHAHLFEQLQRGYSISSKGRKPLAIPVSFTARNAAARGIGPRQAFGNRLRLIYRMIGGRKTGLLVDADVQERTMLSRVPNANSTNVLGLKRYLSGASDVSPGAAIHYVLRFGKVRVKPRKGLLDAVTEEMPLIAKTLGGSWQ